MPQSHLISSYFCSIKTTVCHVTVSRQYVNKHNLSGTTKPIVNTTGFITDRPQPPASTVARCLSVISVPARMSSDARITMTVTVCPRYLSFKLFINIPSAIQNTDNIHCFVHSFRNIENYEVIHRYLSKSSGVPRLFFKRSKSLWHFLQA